MRVFVCLVTALAMDVVHAATIQAQGEIKSVSYTQNSGTLAVFSTIGKVPDVNGFIQIVDVKEGKTIKQFPLGWASPYNTRIALSADAKQLVVAINGIPQAKIWSMETGEVTSEIRLGDFFIDINPLISPDGKTLALATYFESLLVVDMATGKLLFKIPTARTATLKPYFSPSGKILGVIDRDDESLKIYDARTGELKRKFDSVDFGADQTFGGFLSSEDEFVIAVKDGLKRANLKTGEISDTFAPNSYFLLDFAGDFTKQIFVLSSLEDQTTVAQWDGITGDEGPKSTFEKEEKCIDLLPYETHMAVACFPQSDVMKIQLVK